ncbi:cysteine--tRNA ligase [Gardnerella swidsinskii]|uniref:Cysteine--tRNA ligase n=1 Tax=Gardnerella swidsinskii TaxID=2792979 RepID=A0ABM6GI03_9BIFI|nr:MULTISPECIES: cysteine--tRNA ligase [Gardnerella]APW18368.1 cysteine--tRNA ligase [Gardnerella vaginalis]RIY27151.1 cysteine--tRNA ligase [Bifidobacteriaceae bacterium WP021]PMC44838.1 cysteine--tRNA ligase [Gardnerella vaginalis]PNP90741.1 cysteine--tRNA ligase [Gardnerella sp. DNF01162]RFD73746.1 cysteine--tRNA ligase [Gardnerella vaginalis]
MLNKSLNEETAKVTKAAENLHLYNTASHSTNTFVPKKHGQVGMYVCGATVQSSPHIGHIRAAIAFDIIRRWMLRLGYKVTFVRNVTDIDDKIMKKANESGQNWWERAYIYEREFTKSYNTLGVLAPTVEPRATGHITDMVELIERLIERGHAYVIKDNDGNPTGNVYFDVPSWEHYGELTHQNQNQNETCADEAAAIADAKGPSVDAAENDIYNPTDPADASPDKHDPRDFALWKAPCDFDQPDARWKTPFGEGRPGWHIECSAMSHRYLGNDFDIHGGGLDLRFPHHENEMAQTRAAGWESANVWMHSAWVTAKGEKMSKSLGNGLSVPVVLANNSAWVVRYALGAVQYRAMLEWSDQALVESKSAYDRIMNFLERADRLLDKKPTCEEVRSVNADELPEDFTRAMNDDINVSGAIAEIFTTIRQGNTLIDDCSKDSSQAQSESVQKLIYLAVLQVRAMLDTLGLDPYAQTWASNDNQSPAEGSNGKENKEHSALDSLITLQLKARADARKAKDFATADAIRDALNNAGIVIVDTSQESSWHLQ